MRWCLLLLVVALAPGCGCSRARTPLGEVDFEDRSTSVTTKVLVENGGRVDWNAARGLVAFDRLAPDGFFDVWTIAPDGSGEACFTCTVAGLPQKNVGQPAFSPDGEWLVVQVQRPDGETGSFGAHPGRGVDNELWAVRWSSSEAFRLTATDGASTLGVLHPHFSPGGASLTWTEMVEPADLLSKAKFFGVWRLKTADFVVGASGPTLENVRTVTPGGDGHFYENHGQSPNGLRWVFTANLDGSRGYAEINDIYLSDFPSGDNLVRFTVDGYNEHATVLADGERLVWMSNAGNSDRGTDYWLANLDGSGLMRLSHLNAKKDEEDRQVAADVSVGPDGHSFVGYVQGGVGGDVGRVILFTGLP